MLLEELTADPPRDERDNRVRLPPDRLRRANRGAVVTMTRARTVAEAQQLCKSLRVLSQAGLPIYVGEGGSIPEFVSAIRRLPNVRVCALPEDGKPTLVNQVRTAFAEAQKSAPDYVIYTEPDKASFFRSGFISLAQAGRFRPANRLGLVLAARNARGLATFPQGQKVAERFMNRICSEALGKEGDYTYGPMLISQRLLPCTQLVPENLGWGWRFFVMAVARQLRLPIELRTVASQCPRAQRNEDDLRARDYGLRQLVENVTGLANGWTCLLDNPAEIESAIVTAA